MGTTLSGGTVRGSQAPIGRGRFLVVEDDPGLGRSLKRVIGNWGGNATVVGSVHSACRELAGSNGWTGLIVDLHLPDGSGQAVIQQARDEAMAVPALILTAHVEREAINAALELEAQFLAKPATTAQIQNFLRSAERRSRNGICAPSVSNDAFPEGILPPDLQPLAQRVLDIMAERDTLDVEYAYRMAALARAASGRHVTGHAAVDICAKALKISREALEAYIVVTARWDPSEIRDLLRHDGNSQTITMSHLLLIARSPRRLHADLIARVRSDRLNVRQLRLLLRDQA